jgi:hypothetical protein
MALFLRPLRSPRLPCATFSSPSARRTFTSSISRALKEDHKDPSGNEAEQLKQKQLDKQKQGDGHWHEGLASSGESNVKADREQVGDHDEHIGELQQQGKEQADKGEV